MTDVDTIQGDELKEGDTDPNLRLKLLEDGTDKDLTGFTATLRMRGTRSDTIKVNDAMTLANARDGIVEYSWGASDTDEAGIYEAEVEIDDGSGTVMTFPNDSMFQVVIHEIIK